MTREVDLRQGSRASRLSIRTRSVASVVGIAGSLPMRDLRLGVRREGPGVAEDVLMVRGIDTVGAARDDKAARTRAAIVILRARHGGRAKNTESNRGDHRRLSKLQHCPISRLSCSCRTCPIDRSRSGFIPDKSFRRALPAAGGCERADGMCVRRIAIGRVSRAKKIGAAAWNE